MTAIILSPDDLTLAVQELRAGGIIGLPTETVYGLAGDARNVGSVTKIFAAKDRPHFDPLIVHVPSDWKSVAALHAHQVIDQQKMTVGMTQLADALIKTFWPGPLTLLLPRSETIPDLVTSGLDRVGVRMPAHPVAQSILCAAQTPLAAPSANRFGRISPTTAAHVFAELGDRIPFIVDGGACEVGVESTVVSIQDGRVSILRPGKIGARELEAVLAPLGGAVDRATSVLDQRLRGNGPETAQESPGTLTSHYAPVKPLFVLKDGSKESLARIPLSLHARAVAVLQARADHPEFLTALRQSGLVVTASIDLTSRGDAVEAAQTLFSAMRALDDSDAGVLLCEDVPTDDGLWHAVRDRLLRAGQK